MNLDELIEAWRSQDSALLYSVNANLLQQSLRQEQANAQRILRIEARIMYGVSTLVFAGLAFILVLMLYDDDPRTTFDFVIVVLGGAAALLWAGHLYLAHKRKALRERRFGASLRGEIGRHLALMEFELSRVWRICGVLLYTVPMFVCVSALYLAIGRINNEPLDWSLGAGGLYIMAAALVYGVWIARHSAEREMLPRKRRLEALMEQLKEP